MKPGNFPTWRAPKPRDSGALLLSDLENPRKGVWSPLGDVLYRYDSVYALNFAERPAGENFSWTGPYGAKQAVVDGVTWKGWYDRGDILLTAGDGLRLKSAYGYWDPGSTQNQTMIWCNLGKAYTGQLGSVHKLCDPDFHLADDFLICIHWVWDAAPTDPANQGRLVLGLQNRFDGNVYGMDPYGFWGEINFGSYWDYASLRSGGVRATIQNNNTGSSTVISNWGVAGMSSNVAIVRIRGARVDWYHGMLQAGGKWPSLLNCFYSGASLRVGGWGSVANNHPSIAMAYVSSNAPGSSGQAAVIKKMEIFRTTDIWVP